MKPICFHAALLARVGRIPEAWALVGVLMCLLVEERSEVRA